MTFIVKQRRTKQIPGANGYITISLGDITAGQVLTSMKTALNREIIADRSVTKDKPVKFTFDGKTYQLTLTRMVNVLVGQDYAEFSITEPPTKVPVTITSILAIIARSKHSFARGGKTYSGKQAAEHLRQKWQLTGGKNTTAEKFINNIASQSTTTGEAYQVHQADGTKLPLAQWLWQASAIPQPGKGIE